MANTITYDVKQFHWNGTTRTFHGEAPHLVGLLPDGHFHNNAFPSGKKQFVIKNFETDGFRRFRFMEELNGFYLFMSEDGIRCVICVDPERYDEGFFF